MQEEPSASPFVERPEDKNARIEGSLKNVHHYITGLTQPGLKIDPGLMQQLQIIQHHAEVGLGYKPDVEGDEIKKSILDNLKSEGFGYVKFTEREMQDIVNETRVYWGMSPNERLKRILSRKGISYDKA